jgi:hypothetical membrane protein
MDMISGISRQARAGALMAIGATWLMMGILVSESFSRGYTATRMISDLGVGSTAGIYNLSIIGPGILFAAAAFLLYRDRSDRLFAILLALTGIGAAGAGILTETAGAPHAICAAIAFLLGNLCAITGFRLFLPPWSWFSLALGIISLAALVLLGVHMYLGLSAGGMERMAAYPIIFWALGTGAHLMAQEPKSPS